MNIKKTIIVILTLTVTLSFSQEKEEQKLLALKKANNYVYEGNQLANEDDFVAAEMEYRKALSENPSNAVGAYNLANSYYKKGSLEEALYRQQQVVETSTSKEEKHKAFHNIGNILMKSKKCKEAVEAYKSALRNDPTDDETRYNLGIAKECAEQQKDQEDQNKDNKDDKDKQDENKDNKDQDQKDKEGDNKEDQKDKGDQDKKEGDDKKDEDGKPKDDKKDQDKGKQDEQKKDQQQPKPQPGKLSDQQIKSLLEAMNNQEQKVQEKMNAEKQKGVQVKTEKDW
jgi:tetratricopeptide (TPR) repeat protein